MMTNFSNLTRRTFLQTSARTALAGTALSFAQPRAGAQEPPSRPNVILIITDDQGFGDLGIHGNPHIRTPNLDRLAQESIEFTRFHVSPVCAPTRASLMTGRYNYRTGVVDTYIGRAMMHSDEITLAEVLGGAGYKTGIFGKWHLGDNYPLRAIDQGFQEALVHNGGGIGQPSDPPGNMYQNPVLFLNGNATRFEGYCTDIFFDAALQYIERNCNRPFFAYIATNAPHTPLQIADRYVQPYLDMGLNDDTARVYGMVENIDENVGKLLRKLDDLQLAENTILIFMTDNGNQQNRYTAGLRGRKGTVYEGGIHVPFIIRYPQRWQMPRKIDNIAAHIDIMPTLLQACGVPLPDVKIDGQSLVPLLEGETPEWDRTLFFQWHRGDEPEPFRDCAVCTPRYKLINGKELYDLENDPAEEHDIAAENPKIVQELRRRYEEWFKDVSSTRGYAPPRIHLGTEHENPVTLTRQDWRGPQAGWNKDSLGYWEVYTANSGMYDVILRVFPREQPSRIHFKLGDVHLQHQLDPNMSFYIFEEVQLPEGEGRLEAWVEVEGRDVGVSYVDVRKVK
ncbi:MAG: sulfatase-like hydrolase/transferase [bacterium]|jgi:arylsulfatase A-like enzyme